jgi:hypothetical protein
MDFLPIFFLATDSALTALIKTLPGLAWVVLVGAALYWFRSEVRFLLNEIVWRIKAGATFKVSSIEIGAPYVTHNSKESQAGIEVRLDGEGIFAKERLPFRTVLRNLFIVHQLAPSRDLSCLYDVQIYLIPSLHYGSLAGVKSVDYYFGESWEKNIFTSYDRGSGFTISTSAWAPFSCTARVNFSDGEHVFLHRLIDFEMGPVGSIPYKQESGRK